MRLQAYRAVDQYAYDRVKHFLVRRRKVRNTGARQFSRERVYGDFGVLRLLRVHPGPPPCASR